ncbi:hypothetical protein [Pararhodobacter sp. SW119]|uniref:hypothetical protein n=1 Tax=Pararhodobacter sp. SW119 TaxID=2780075 RepID=UPI001ADF74FC|nr:hypothetical protein [Pararhodobacter sp. SW119]
MKAFLAAVVIAVVFAYGAALLLHDTWQTPSHSAFTTEGARVSDPGQNLIGN